MAFSGQYAAAQLHHLPLPHSLIGELSDFLGYAPNFAPPTYVKFARVYGRLPGDRIGCCSCRAVDDDSMNERCCSTEVHWSDFRNKDFRTDLFGNLQVEGWLVGGRNALHIKVDPDRVRPALSLLNLHLPMRDEDLEFFRRWDYGPGVDHAIRLRHGWPYAADGTIQGIVHPAIAGAVRIRRHWLRNPPRPF